MKDREKAKFVDKIYIRHPTIENEKNSQKDNYTQKTL